MTQKIRSSFLKVKEDILSLKELFNSWIFHLQSNQKELEQKVKELESRVRFLELQRISNK